MWRPPLKLSGGRHLIICRHINYLAAPHKIFSLHSRPWHQRASVVLDPVYHLPVYFWWPCPGRRRPAGLTRQSVVAPALYVQRSQVGAKATWWVLGEKMADDLHGEMRVDALYRLGEEASGDVVGASTKRLVNNGRRPECLHKPPTQNS